MDKHNALGKEEGINTTDLQREDIEVLTPDAIRITKALHIGIDEKMKISEETGIKPEEVEKTIKSLESRGFVRNYKNKVKLTNKGKKLFVRKFDIFGPLLMVSFVATFFGGVVEMSRFIYLFAPLKFEGTPTGFWIIFYAGASWLDFVGALVLLVSSLAIGYAIIERRYRQKEVLRND